MNSQTVIPGTPSVPSPNTFTRDNLQTILANVQAMKARGATEATDPEYANLLNLLRTYQQQSFSNAQNKSASNALAVGQSQTTSSVVGQTTASAANMPSTAPAANSTPLSSEQLMSLKYQILAFKLISKNIPVPVHLQQVMFQSGQINNNNTPKQEPVTSIPAKIVEAAFNHHNVNRENPPSADSPAPSISSAGSNYNAYTNPYDYLQRLNTAAHGNISRQQRMLIPSITPVGLDPYAIAQEREHNIRARVLNRIRELEMLPSNLSNYPLKFGDFNNGEEKLSGAKLKAIIELKSLRLLEKQRKLRQEIIKSMSKATTLATSTDRAAYRRMKKQSLRDARITERLERQQRIDRERREKQKHLDYLQSICNHGREMLKWHATHQQKQSKLGKAVLSLHAQVEKDEQKRSQQTARERLQALKEDDEQKYLQLIDEAKDKRIHHLLKQTNSYLDSLAQAVVAQQNTELHHDPSVRGGIELMDEEEEEEEEVEISDGKKIDYYAVAHKIKEEVEQPGLLNGGTLKEYQVKGLQWMVSLYNNRLNGILADEMGLGKTIQTISLIAYLIERKKQNGPFLIIVPLSTLTNWTMEFEKWAPTIVKCVYKGVPHARKEIEKAYIRHSNFQVLLTTYEYSIKDKSVLSKIRWVYMIIDEGHRMKNTNSKLSMILTNNYQSRYRLILTGTPLQNNLPELWSLLNFVLPKIFDSVKSFDEWFNTPFANAAGQDKIELNEEEKLLIIRRLHKVLRPFLLRRLKKDVESELPDKIERVVKCKLSALQLRLYNQMKKYGLLFVNTGEKGKTGIRGLNNTIMQLRKICNHPFVFPDVERDINPYNNNTYLYRVAGKFELLDRILGKLIASSHRVLIFFQMTSIMTIMEDFLNYRKFLFLRLDGSTKSDERSILLKKFNTPGSEYSIFLLSTRAGGLGLNLQSADTVIIFDSDWNPHQDLQAQDRAHRIGQTKEVRILRLVTQKSIEETILARAQYKLDIDGKVIQAGKFDNKSTNEEREAFLRTLLEGDNDEVNDVNDEEELNDDELNEIIARNDHELKLYKEIDAQRYAEEPTSISGRKFERLIQDWELPDNYRRDEDTMLKNHQDAAEYGRGQRARTQVHYDDGLTEEQWVEAIEDEQLDINEVIQKKQLAKVKREEKRRKKLEKSQQVDQRPKTQEPEIAEPIENRKKRGRPRKNSLGMEEHGSAEASNKFNSPSGNKRKAKGKQTIDIEETAQQPPAKKRRVGPLTPSKKSKEKVIDNVPRHIREAMNKIFKQLYDSVENCMDYDDGEPRQRCYLFLELVRKQDYPQYYQLITKPIAMNVIRKKMKNNEYPNLETYKKDWHLMFDNAMIFNENDSQVYQDAVKMKELFDEKYEELTAGFEYSFDNKKVESGEETMEF
ncbi:hypothetical protein G9A89_017972 [Geosiphon pyriformis]|nr:hypothetical protein G9A89_017972 [Geosiphon pyriformis]